PEPACRAVALALLAFGCERAGGAERAASSTTAATPACVHTTEPVPLLRVGPDQGRDLAIGAMTGAVLGPRDEVVVADRVNRRVRFFDSAGTLVASAGRRGAGPGEYQRIYSVHRLEGDTILVEDIELRRFTFYMPDGRLVRTERFADEIPMAAPV